MSYERIIEDKKENFGLEFSELLRLLRIFAKRDQILAVRGFR